jgi:hypothetical protein
VEEEETVGKLIKFEDWAFVRFSSELSVAGFDVEKEQARVSTPVVAIDIESHIATTQSGSRYKLGKTSSGLHRLAKIILATRFSNRRFTIMSPGEEGDNTSRGSVLHQARSLINAFQQNPYPPYQSKASKLLRKEFTSTSDCFHVLSFCRHNFLFIGKSHDEFTLWNEFALSHPCSQEVEEIFTQQNCQRFLATEKASQHLERGELSKVVIDSDFPIIFSRSLWDEMCRLSTVMVNKLVDLTNHKNGHSLALSPPTKEGRISWALDNRPSFHSRKSAGDDLVEKFDSNYYLLSILDKHYRAVQSIYALKEEQENE